MTTVLITGSNRGIGFELIKQYAADPKNIVIATTRSLDNATELKKLNRENIHIIQLDVNDTLDKVKQDLTVLNKIAPSGVDVVVHNAAIGLFPEGNVNLTNIDLDIYTKNFNTNVLGSIKVYQAVYPYWIKKTGNLKKFIFVSSLLGWINNYLGIPVYGYGLANLGIPGYGYGLSKAGVNFFAKEVSHFHSKSDDKTVKESITVAIHPGVVATDMSKDFLSTADLGDFEILTPSQSGEKLKALFDSLSIEDNGNFKSYDGKTVLW